MQGWNEEFDQESGVEDACDEEQGRKRSAVSFNLRKMREGGAKDEDFDSDENFYPRHFRSIEDTFDVWRDCYRRADSRASAYSSAGVSSTPLPCTPELTRSEPDDGEDTQSLASGLSVRETETSTKDKPACSPFEGEVSDGQHTASMANDAESHNLDAGLTAVVSFLTERDEDRADSAEETTGNLPSIQSCSEGVKDTSGANQNDLPSKNMNSFPETALSVLGSEAKVAIKDKGEASQSALYSKKGNISPETDLSVPASDEEAVQNFSETINDEYDASQSNIPSKKEQYLTKAHVSIPDTKNEVVQRSVEDMNDEGNGSQSDPFSKKEHLSAESDLTIPANEEEAGGSGERCPGAEETEGYLAEAVPPTAAASPSETTEVESIGNELLKEEAVLVGPGESHDRGGETTESHLAGTGSSRAAATLSETAEVDSIRSEPRDEEATACGEKSHDGGREAIETHTAGTDSLTVASTRSETTESDNLDVERILEGDEISTVCSDDGSLATKVSLRGNEFLHTAVDQLLESETSSQKSREENHTTAVNNGKDSWDSKESFLEVVQQVGNASKYDAIESIMPKETGSEEDQETADILTETHVALDNEGGGDVTDTDTRASVVSLQGIRGIFSARPSTVNTSVAFDQDDDSLFSEDGPNDDEHLYDLSTRHGLDNFKTFLLETSGENYIKFWLEIECGKYLESDEEKTRYVQKDRQS